MGVEGHTGALRPRALKLEQGNVVLPALALVLAVHHNALRGQRALKVVTLHRVVVAKTHHVAGRVRTKPGGERGGQSETRGKEREIHTNTHTYLL